MNDLPLPDSEELKKLVKGSISQKIYRVLYENRDKPLTLAQIREGLNLTTTEQGQFDRRMRDLYPIFEFEKPRNGSSYMYRIVKLLDVQLNTSSISAKIRAEVLKEQRCAQCGKTPLEDQIKLDVDHKIPQKWGGTNDIDNLQPLCKECNNGKRDFYATFDEYTEQIKAAVNYDEPHRRIGELLKVFKGEPVPSQLLERVANAKQYQDDWQKRMRELRVLGWMIDSTRQKEGKRFVAYYALRQSKPWPEGNIRKEITRLERLKKSESQ